MPKMTKPADPRDFASRKEYLAAANEWARQNGGKPLAGDALAAAEDQWKTYGHADAVDNLLGESRGVRTENAATIDEMIGAVEPGLGVASAGAQASTAAGLAGLQGAADGFSYDDLPDYVGDVLSKASGAKADKRAVKAQYSALDQLSALTSPEVTAKEQFLKEQSRQTQERDQRSYLDAVLSNLEARGQRSGGAEISAALGAQQETGNRRMLEDLGTNAGAVDRAMAALQGYGDLASGIRGQSFGEDFSTRTAADDATKFSKTLRSDYDARMTVLADKRNDAGWDRDKDVFEGGREAARDTYGYQTDPLKFKERAAAMKTGQYSGDTAPVIDATKFTAGERSARDAVSMLNNKEFDLTDPSSWF